ncbi:MAG: DUF58 domain-containing protein [Actinobacteria bacterium]|nr:MAG: DUF58 domain-containing protein [Actinomycetota bacterium]
MLTTRGWALAAGNLALLIAGRLLGVRELFELGLGLSTLVIAACIVVRRGGHDTRLARAVDPLEVYPGSLVRVEVSIRAGARRSPPLLFVEELPADLADGVPGLTSRLTPRLGPRPPKAPARTLATAGNADQARKPGRRAIAFPVGAIEARGVHHIAYQVTPPKRGRYEIGPGSTVVTDAFGLARAPDRPLAKSFLLVFPAIEVLPPFAAASPHSVEGTPRPLAPTPVGDEFFTMREYQPGDDVKKIHWRTTARQGRLMVRQEDRPSEPRAMVLLDDRRRSHARRSDGADSFEACVSSAASLVHLFTSQGLGVGVALASRMGMRPGEGGQHAGQQAGRADPLRHPGGPSDARAGWGFGKGTDHQRALMQRLALLGMSGSGDLAAGIGELLGPRTGTTYLAVVTTEIDPGWELHAAAGARLEHGLPIVVVRHLRHTYLGLKGERLQEEEEQARGAALLLERYGGTVIDVRAGEPLKPAWEQRVGLRVHSEAAAAR